MSKNPRAEAAAYAKLGQAIELAETAAGMFREAGVLVPGLLLRMLGEEPTEALDTGDDLLQVSPPPLLVPPPGASSSWIWLDTSDASISTLAWAWLKISQQPLSVNEIAADLISRMGRDVVIGSVYNAIRALLAAGRITESGGEYLAAANIPSPILDGDARVWATLEMLQSGEIAEARRFAILYLLSQVPDGATPPQIRDTLELWIGERVGALRKDHIRGDLMALAAEKRVAKDESGRWKLKS